MRVEDRFDLLGAQRRQVIDDHALRLATAEPQPPFPVDPAQVAHAMHDAFAAVGQAFADLRERGRGVAAEIRIGRGRAGDGDFADLPGQDEQRVGPLGDRVVVDAR
jgi:hypothetical protein